MMYRIGILEDEPEQSSLLISFIRRFETENSLEGCGIDVFDTAEKLLNAYDRQFHVLFLDICLPDMLGIEAAAKIREKDENVIIIFVTNLTQYAIDGYTVSAFDYVLKPLQYASFSSKLERVIRILQQKQSVRVLTLKSKQETWKLRSDEITYIESMGHDLVFHTTRKTVSVWGTLTAYEKELDGLGFSRCNASFLVNLHYVNRIFSSAVQVDGIVLPLSRTRRKQFLADFAAFKGGTY